MKRSKKLLALVLALVMAFSFMAVTAAAYGGEEHEHVCSEEAIQPRKPAALCPKCKQPMNEVRTYRYGDGWRTEFICPDDNETQWIDW